MLFLLCSVCSYVCFMLCFVFFFFFFKQKTAYEMRISDWSSDVCSSDLEIGDALGCGEVPRDRRRAARGDRHRQRPAGGEMRLQIDFRCNLHRLVRAVPEREAGREPVAAAHQRRDTRIERQALPGETGKTAGGESVGQYV